MGRELRKVPKNWEHPKDENGNYIPLLKSFAERHADWVKQKEMWEKGLRDDFNGGWKPIEDKYKHMTFEEWDGNEPQRGDYMPEWSESEKTYFQMYEDTTEGTPISPVMESAESLARWLADNNVSAFADMTASYESWLKTILAGSSPSAIVVGGKILPGTEINQ